ncbi:MAG: hypothetical protein KF901_33670, partial [Myxococcales bacterium]|nr:hypothetical protein [Myxococcales bacterium]
TAAGAGGGGALRIASGTRVVLRGGSLLARGGRGGTANLGTGGGGGSGGVIYIAAPEVDLESGTVDVRGGNGGGGGSSGAPGGNGGLGRIRLSVDPLFCNINAVTSPPTTCDDGVATPGRGYVGRYPN